MSLHFPGGCLESSNRTTLQRCDNNLLVSSFPGDLSQRGSPATRGRATVGSGQRRALGASWWDTRTSQETSFSMPAHALCPSENHLSENSRQSLFCGQRDRAWHANP